MVELYFFCILSRRPEHHAHIWRRSAWAPHHTRWSSHAPHRRPHTWWHSHRRRSHPAHARRRSHAGRRPHAGRKTHRRRWHHRGSAHGLWRRNGHASGTGCEFARLEGCCGGVDEVLCLVLHPLLVVKLDILLVLAAGAMGLSHRRRIVGQVSVAVVTKILRHLVNPHNLWIHQSPKRFSYSPAPAAV